MNYIDKIAERVYHAVDPDSGDFWEGTYKPLYRIYAVLALVKGELTTLRDVHDAWSAWQTETLPEHRSLIPFDQLTHDVKELDRPYMEAIHQIAYEILREQYA